MQVDTFIKNFRNAFGEKALLPFAFWHSDTPISDDTSKINGCFFQEFAKLSRGEAISLSADRIGCMGGKFYTGFAPMGEHIPTFVSCKEKYKQTPDLVLDFINKTGVPRTDKKYLNIAPVDKLDNFDGVTGIFFLATADMLSGLASWAFFDNNSDDAVTARFGSGCSSIFTEAVVENSRNGRRTFIGLFDPSVRRYMNPDVLSFTIPMSRFKEMYYTLPQCSLSGTPAWSRIKERLEK